MTTGSISTNLVVTVPDAEEKVGETKPITHILGKDGLVETFDSSVTTLFENFNRAVQVYGTVVNAPFWPLLNLHVQSQEIRTLSDPGRSRMELPALIHSKPTHKFRKGSIIWPPE